MRVEHTGDGVTRRPTVLKTVAVTGLHALPQLTIHTLAASAASRSCVLHSGRGNRSLPARKSLSVRYLERERAGTSFATAAEAALFCDAFRTAEAARFHVGLSAAGFPQRSTPRVHFRPGVLGAGLTLRFHDGLHNALAGLGNTPPGMLRSASWGIRVALSAEFMASWV